MDPLISYIRARDPVFYKIGSAGRLLYISDDSSMLIMMQVLLVALLLILLAVIIVFTFSVRKRRKAEKQLEVSQDPLNLVISAGQQAYWDMRLNSREETMISPRFFEMLGYLPGEIKPDFNSWENLIHPDDRGAVDAALNDHYQGKTPFYQHEHRFLAKSGEWRWILGRGMVVQWTPDGKPQRVTGTYTDVSENHRFNETMRSLLQMTVAVSGGEFFNCLVSELSKLMHMRYAQIGYLLGPENISVRSVSVSLDGRIIENVEYQLAGMPCEQILSGGLFVCVERVQDQFPDDEMLRSLDAQSYVGVPLLNRDDAIIGMIVMIDDHPLAHRDFVENILTIFASRIAIELEQMQFKKALSESEHRWQFALEGTGDGVWDWDIDGKTASFSAAFKKMLGYSDYDFPNRIEAWTTRVHPEDLSFVMSEQERHLRGEIAAIYIEYRLKCKDGRYKWVLGRGKVMEYSGDGSPVRLVGTITDITARKNSEKILQETMSKYQSLFSEMSEGFVLSQLIMDGYGQPKDYLLLDANPSFVSLVNIPLDQLIGGLGSELFGQTDGQSLKVYSQVALTGKPDHLEVYFKTGQKHLSIHVFSPERGKFASVFTDVTERKNIEVALVKERNLLRTLVDNIPDAIYAKDLEYRKTLTNKADMANSGAISEKEILGKTDFEVWPRELAERFYEHDRYVLESGVPIYKQEELISASGLHPRWILTAKLPLLDQDGNVTGLLGIGREITETKLALLEIQRLNVELEQRVAERTSQLELVVKELEAFSYSVSHDLRAPLRTMDGFSSALMEDYGSQLDETARGYLGRIQTASKRMSQLIDDLLKLSRITRSEVRRGPANLSEIASSIAAELKHDHPDKLVTWMICPEMHATADANLIRIVLENLLGNAWKFSAKHGSARIEVNFYLRDGQPVYYVRDDGAGFDMAYAKKLFGPFQRMHGAADFEGSGIGLATVQRIIHRHGGEVWAESGVEKGTTIYFTLD